MWGNDGVLEDVDGCSVVVVVVRCDVVEVVVVDGGWGGTGGAADSETMRKPLVKFTEPFTHFTNFFTHFIRNNCAFLL